MSTDFPINSLRHFLMPNQLVQLKSFEADSLDQLDAIVSAWVNATQNVIAIVGTPVKSNNKYAFSLTYVPAVEGNKRG